MEHLGGADAIKHLQPGGLLPELARGVRQAFARAHADAQPADAVHFGERGHLAVEGWRGVADGGAHAGDQLHHGLGRVGDGGEVHRGAGPHGKHQQAAQAEGECQRGRAHHDVVGCGAQHVARPGLAGGDQVAVRVHGGFGAARGARGEGQQGDVVGAGGAGRGLVAGVARQGLQRVGQHHRRVAGVEHAHGHARAVWVGRERGLELVLQLHVAQRR
ncbi:hypothetical protein D9M69_564940 [compost metagenome]